MEHLSAVKAWCIPPAEARVQHTTSSLLFALALPIPLLWLMAHLLLTYPRQRAPRLALLPFAIAVSLRASYFARMDPQWGQNINMALGCYAAWNIERIVWWCFETKQYSLRKEFKSSLSSSFLFISTMRYVGLGFTPIPKTNSLSRSSFLKTQVKDILVASLLTDIAETLIKDVRFSPVLSSGSGLEHAQSGLLGRASGPVLNLLTGVLIYAPMSAEYSLFSLLSVLLFPSTQPHWSDPAFASPLQADSVRNFWSHRWHQLFRVPFSVLGSAPISRLAHQYRLPRALHDAFATLGVFAISALHHEAGSEGMRTSGQEGFFGQSGAVTQFFMLQGVGCILEQLWLRCTGRRVAGWAGRVWTYAWLLGTGMRITDAWMRHGFIRGFSSCRLTQPVVNGFAILLQR